MAVSMIRRAGSSRVRGRRGHAVIEFSLLAPWFLLLFAGIFDFGIYSNALIMTENAARATALETANTLEAAGDTAYACSLVRQHMKAVSNLKNLSACNALPLIVTATAGTDTEGFDVTRVSVTYQTPALFTLPNMPGRLTITRVAEMRVK